MSIPAMKGGEAIGGPNRSARLFAAGVAAGVAIVGLYHADSAWDERRFPSTSTELIGDLDGVTKATLVFPGLGSTSGALQAEQIRTVVGGEVAHMSYSSDHVSVHGLATVLRDRVKHLEEVNVFGHSMGALLGLESLAEAGIPNLKLGNVFMIGSPYRTANVRNWQMASLVQKARLINGPSSKFVGSFIRGVTEDRLRPGPAFKRAKKDAQEGCAGRQFGSMLTALRDIDESYENRAEIYAPLVGPNTKFWYCRPVNPLLDQTVMTIPASREYERLAKDLGRPFELVFAHMGHAGYTESIEELQKRFERDPNRAQPSPGFPLAA